jgi:hypothetical protein
MLEWLADAAQLCLAGHPYFSVCIIDLLAHRILIASRPGAQNAVIALLITLINIFTAQNGVWSATAVASVCIAGLYGFLMFISYGIYQLYVLERLKKTA